MTNFAEYRSLVGSTSDTVFKSTLFQSPRLLLGLNCLEPGQTQKVHTHAGRDKFYFVLEGTGEFVVGEETRTCGEGHTIWAPADVEHGVTNTGTDRMVVLVGIAPAPGK